MGKSMIGSVLFLALFGSMILPMSSFAENGVKIEQAEEAIRVEDTVGAVVPTEKVVSNQPPEENLVVEEVNEGAVPAESLGNMPSGESGTVSIPDTMGAFGAAVGDGGQPEVANKL